MTENTSAVVGGAWLAVVAGVVGNTVASLAGDSMPVHLGFGALTTVGVVTLVVNWLHRR
ncbi:hypothetical protein GCM10022223_57900 [Kineosporia mesophila]|uniref:GlsB/YeaQ/YmgE family stress response membrane protein n=1 Tax=Kineosporia mesophila TaxID=566012 RepID=A0ABP7AH52_9ACTN|nr:hypothetical protein [Kineosporia mesophila]MCD5350846.1 hypothetical protein [Kineosporia mesophila]